MLNKHLRDGLLTTALVLVTLASISSAEAQTGETARAMEEIVVTAQRRQQSLLDVPVAVSSLPSDSLEDYAIDNILDLAILHPSLSGTTVANPVTATDLRIRGIGTTGSNAGFETSVGMYVDDIYYSRPGLAYVSFFDLQSVEIFRGPQGTLFGRNITAGAVAQKTAAPVIGERESYVTAEIAEFDSYDLEAAINIPLGANSALRLSGVVDNTDGFMDNVTTGDDDAAFSDIWGVRVQYLVEPSDKLSIRIVADASEYESGRFYQAVNSMNNPDGSPVILPNGRRPGFYDTTTSYASTATTEQMGIAAHVEYQINDTITLKSITSYRDVDSDNLDGDWDFSFNDVAGDLDETQDMKTFSQEFLLTFETDNAFITTGLHYFDEEIDYRRFNTDLTPTLGGGTFQNVAFLQDEESLGIFAHVDYTLSDQFSIIAGMRYSQVDKDIEFRNTFGTPEEVYDNLVNDFFLNLFFSAGGGADNAFPYDDSVDFDEVTGDIALQWRPNDRTQAYIKYSRGFKAGGFNMNEAAAGGRPAPNLPGAVDILGDGRLFQPFDPDAANYDSEIIDSYEISVRYQLDRGLISVTYFDSEIDNLQVGVFTGLNFETFNAPTADASGLEIDFNYNLTDQFSVNAAVTLLDTELSSEFSRAELVRGREFIYAPDTAFVVGANYNAALTNTIQLHVLANVSYHSDEYTRINGCVDGNGNSAVFSSCVTPANIDVFGPNNNAFFENDGHSLVNATVGLTFSDNIEVELFCSNCADKEHTTFNSFTPVVNVRGDYPGAPRTVGIRMRADF